MERLKAKEMADYIERVFNHEKTIELISSAKNSNQAEMMNKYIGEMASVYVISTKDLSDEGIGKLLSTIDKNKEIFQEKDTNENIKKKFVMKGLMPLIASKNGKSLENMSMSEISDMLHQVKGNNVVSQFYTHSFNGALKPNVERDGLNVNNELFKKELADIEKLSGGTLFKKGKLNYCELSEATFGYGLRSPERVRFTLQGKDSPQQGDKENTGDYLMNCVRRSLHLNQELSQEEKRQVFVSAKTISDFYFKNDKVCIAFMENNTVQNYSGTQNGIKTCSAALLTMPSAFVKSLDEQTQEKIKQLRTQTRTMSESEVCESLDLLYGEIEAQNPENKKIIDEMKHKVVSSYMSQSCFSNFLYAGNANGYDAPEGKIDRSKFEIATIPNAVSLYKNKPAPASEMQ